MSANKLFRLASTIYNTPHLIKPSELERILNYIDARNFDFLMPVPEADQEEEDDNEEPTSIEDLIENGIAVINIEGSLTPFPVYSECGQVGMAYSQIEDQVEDYIEAGATTIILEFNSGGGSASHLFETVSNIRQMCDEKDIKLIGYAQTCACSAAYAIACVCDELYTNPSAELANIGCVVSLIDLSKAMEQAGIRKIYLTSGTSKVPFDADGSFKQSFLDDVQAQVDKLGTQFVEHVAKYTGIDAKIIRGFEAASFDAEDSLSNGLVNGIMTNREFVKYVVQNVTTDKGSM